MWVLDARYKAEKVWYSIIWEKAKEDPNVIDYNINEEITKDTSAVFNANNDTTTGMATVIPWVNAPKLIAQTSILWIDYESWYWGTVYFRIKANSQIVIAVWDEGSQMLDTVIQKNNQSWYYDFKWVDWKWIIIPTQWTYQLACDFFYSWWANTYFRFTIDTLVWGNLVHTSASAASEISETFNINAKKWQWIMFRFNWDNTNWTSSCNVIGYTYVTITKK